MELNRLSNREWEIVQLIADGHNDESMSYQLELSIGTIKKHKSNILEKLNMNNSLEICSWYWRTIYRQFDLQSH